MTRSERSHGKPSLIWDAPSNVGATSHTRGIGSVFARIVARLKWKRSTSTVPVRPLSTHYLIVRHEEAIGLLRELVALLPEQRGVKANDALRRARRFVGADDREIEDIVRNLEEDLRNAQ